MRTAEKRIKTKNKRILNVSFTLDETNIGELIDLVRGEIESNDLSVDQCSFGLISLHSCGDLTPLMLKIFANSSDDLKFVAALSCCYHFMKSDDDRYGFENFPMSSKLKELKRSNGLKMSSFSLRLACQQASSSWTTKSEQEHEEHTKQVAYRAILDKYCHQSEEFYIFKKFLIQNHNINLI